MIRYKMRAKNWDLTRVSSPLPCRAVPCLAACLLPDVRGRGAASPLTSHVTKGGRTVAALSYHEVRGGVILSPRSLEQRTAASRRQANSSSDIAARRLPLCAYIYRPGKLPVGRNEPPDPGEQLRRSRRNGYGKCRTNFSGVYRRAETERLSKE